MSAKAEYRRLGNSGLRVSVPVVSYTELSIGSNFTYFAVGRHGFWKSTMAGSLFIMLCHFLFPFST